MLELQLQVGADVRVFVDEGAELGGVETERDDIRAGPHGGGPRHLLEQLDFAEAVARAQHVEGHFVARLGTLDHASPAGDQDEERVRGCAFSGNHRSECERAWRETLHHQRPGGLWKEAQNRKPAEYARVAHAAPARPPLEM